MKYKLRTLAPAVLLLCAAALPAAATPILSADGSLMSGLDVAGTLYDVHFGDTISTNWHLTEPDWPQFTTDLTLALVSALDELGTVGSDISGCTADECILFVADRFVTASNFGVFWYDSNPAFFDGQTWGVSLDTASLARFLWGPHTPTPADLPNLTLVNVVPNANPVPVPATAGLIGLAITLLASGRKRR